MSAHSSMPSSRTAASSPATRSNRSQQRRRERRAGELAGPLDGGHPGHRHDPGHDRGVTAGRGHPVTQPQIVLGVEEHLGDREVGAGPALADEVGGVGRPCRASAGCLYGNAATPTLKSPDSLTSRTRSSAYSTPSGCRTHSPIGSPGGSPRTASTLRMPAPASRPMTLRSSATEWSTAVRWAIGSSVVSVGDPLGHGDRGVPGGAAGTIGDRDEARAATTRARGSPARAAARRRASWAGRTRTRTWARTRGSARR